MKFRLVIFIFFTVFAQFSYSENDAVNIFEEMKQESIIFNKTVTDLEIIEYFETIYKYQPDNLNAFKSQDSDTRKSFLAEYKDSHKNAGIKIPILRGLSKEELKEFDEVVKYKTDEAIRIKSAQKRLLSFSTSDYKLMLEEAIALIGKYSAYKKEGGDRRVLISSGFPEKLAFLKLESIYLYENHCMLLLQNGIGKDIGYNISKDKNGVWQIKSFDHYKSWDSSQIELGSQ